MRRWNQVWSMGSLKALQDWCRSQCESYRDVEITNMTSSFRDGLAFCAIIHKHRPELIDFELLSKENVFENNRLAFEVAERELGIPALLDPEDMVSMSVPDRLSVITYVSQYYNFFTNRSQSVSTSIKSPSCPAPSKPALKRAYSPPEDQPEQAESGADGKSKSGTLSSSCSACGKHVHLVQRILVDGKLYHRNCFRCRDCCRTLLPGSYKFTEDPGALVCSHHFPRSSSTNQNSFSDTSHQSVGFTPTGLEGDVELQTDQGDCEKHGTEEESKGPEIEGGVVRASTPQNPFDESEEENRDPPLELQRPGSDDAVNGNAPATAVKAATSVERPVPAPRRLSETPAPQPLPRQRRSRLSERAIANGDHTPQIPVPRERRQSPSLNANDAPKPKDPPWLALVQSEHKKKPAPRPPADTVKSSSADSSPSRKEKVRPSTPPNPFDDEEEEEEPEMGAEDPPAHVLPILLSSQTSPSSSSLALSIESLSSSSSDNSAVPLKPAAIQLELAFTKSASEPSINTPSEPSEKNEPCLPPPPPPPPPINTSSAPATPQTNRSVRASNVSPSAQKHSTPGKRTCKENPFNRKKAISLSSLVSRPPKGSRPARPSAPGHGFPLIKRKVQSDQFIPVEDIYVEMGDLDKRLDELEQKGVDLERSLRECVNDDEEEHLLVDWFTLIHDKHLLVRREAELVYTARQQSLEERQADVEYELRCLLNKPENEEEEEDKLVAAMLKKKDFHGQGEQQQQQQKKSTGKFKPMKVLKRLSTKNEGAKDNGLQKKHS
ncbi:hypothetical protein DNTS_013294 [Danionella cerebrum]|uniref:MICAL-like protein 1 n=1 Tax=Danionella cerebrum TaxID=2873325 RepID=A0A553PWN1_9TELE|nr:hypothetical protein DNTS_013294 [Danionella translucida]